MRWGRRKRGRGRRGKMWGGGERKGGEEWERGGGGNGGRRSEVGEEKGRG